MTNAGRLDAGAVRRYARGNMRLLRIALQAVLFFLLLAAVIGIGAPETGVLEKLVLAVIAAGLIWLAIRVRDIGSPHGPRSA
jgi:hypothetical protein